MSNYANATSAGSVEGNGRGARRRSIRTCLALVVLALTGFALYAVSAFGAPPQATMLGVTGVSFTTAQGEADLGTTEFQWIFEVSTDQVTWSQAGPVNNPDADGIGNGEITGLQPATHYYVRVTNYFGGETDPSANSIEITTLAVDPPEVVAVDNVTSPSYTNAHVTGTIKRPANADPAFDTSCYFEYVTDEQLTNNGFEGANQVECEGNPFKTAGNNNVAADLTGLANNTTYHLRLRAKNAGGESEKVAAATFKTLAVTPPKVLSITAPTNIGASGATFHGEVERPANPDPAFEINLCGFEIVTHEQFLINGFETPQYGAGCGEGIAFPPGAPKALSAKNGQYVGYDTMPYGTTYHVRLTVGNVGGVDHKVLPETFSTLPQPAPPAVTITPATAITSRGAHIAGTVNAGGTDALQQAFWRFECTPECTAAGGSTLSGEFYPPEDKVFPVQADLKLKANTDYEVRLVAHSYAGPAYVGPDNSTAPVSFKTPIVINAKTGSATTTTNSAGVSGQVDPGGDITSYHFDYGPDDQYGQSTPTKTLIAGNNLVSVGANITGLQAGTTYHYRLVASNGAGESKGGDRVFVTATPPAAVEDCKKNSLARVQQKSTVLPECRAYEIVNNPSAEVGDVIRVPQVDPEGNAAGWITTTPGKEVSGNNLVSTGVSFRTEDGWVAKDSNPGAIAPTHYLSATIPLLFSRDMTKALMTTPIRADINDTPDSLDYYRVNVGTGGTATWLTPEHVGFDNLVGASADLSKVVYFYWNFFLGPSYVWITSNGVDREPIPVVDGEVISALANGVSSDASRVFFTYYDYFEGKPAMLYMRNTVAKTTLPVSISQRTGEVGTEHSAKYFGSSSDAEVVYFLSKDQLTDAATPNGGFYRFNTSTKALSQVTPKVDATEGINPTESQFPSDNKTRFYFKSSHAMLPGTEEGAENIYAVENDSTKLVTSMPAGSNLSLQRVSTNGRYLLMMSTASVDGAPNNSRSALYLYDIEDGNISCVSCRPSGGKSLGGANLAYFPLTYPNCCLNPRGITDTGGVFFASTDQLLPADETPSQDIYYYHGGSLALMTTGKGDKDSYLGGNTPSGDDVFIMTRSALVAEDEDAEEMDIYDVRVDGGFYRKPDAGALCQGEACRTNPSQPAPASAPSTPSFIGADNSQSGRNQGRKKNKNKNKNKGKHKGKNGKGKKHGKNQKHKSSGRSDR